MYYLIKADGIFSARSLKKLNKQNKILLEEKEFKILGADKVVKLTDEDLDFLADKKRLSDLAIGKLFRKKNDSVIFFILLLILNLIILLQSCSGTPVTGG